MRKIGLYIHIPFCVSKCAYCDFNSYMGKDDKQRDYLIALVNEIRFYASRVNGVEIDTIYIGGGTPSTMFPGAITTILAEIKKSYKVLPTAEISIEANPNSITMQKAMEWKSAGINRVSVGLQTTNVSALKTLGRAHTKKDYINSIKILQSAGFNNINTDLMIGLPKQKSSDVKYAINLCAKLGCTHISCYSLILEENTPIYRQVCENIVKLPKEEKTIGMYVTANRTLTKLGYHRYEVSNFAMPGYECKHNLNCWDMHEYLGFGAGAHGYIDDVRYNNILGIEEYIAHSKDINNIVKEKVNCTKQDIYDETIMLGLRKTDGVDITKLNDLLDESFLQKYKGSIKKYLDLGYIAIEDNKLCVTEDGLFVLNQIIIDFTI